MLPENQRRYTCRVTMFEYFALGEAADAVYRMSGVCVGDRDLAVKLLDRIIYVPATWARGLAGGEWHVGNRRLKEAGSNIRDSRQSLRGVQRALMTLR